ncbi:MAG: methionine aminotransferase [Saprospiraceae bacterium]
MNLQSKLPNVGTNIFSVMSALANEHQAINLSQGFPNFDCAPELKNLVNKYLQNGFNQYAPMGGANVLLEKLASKIEKLYGASVNPKTEITITAGATQALFTVITTFVKSGDEVIIIEPAYDSYVPSIEVCGGMVVPYEMKAPDFKINWEELEKLITSKTRMLIFNTPHNPTGSILLEDDLKTIERIGEEHDLIVLSDEVYEHLIFDGQQHQSVLRFPKLFQRSLAVYSFGKTFHATGWKMGYCVAPEHLMQEFRKVHQFNVFCVNSFVQQAIAEYLEDENTYLNLNNFYQQKRDFFLEKIKNSKLRPLKCSGTYFQLVDYSEISDEDEFEFAKRMTTEFGVAVIPVSAFYSKKVNQKIVRVCFAKTENLLAEAAELFNKI